MNKCLPIHKDIYDKLDEYIETKKIPNILFYGENGSGKKNIIYSFINKIYNNDHNLIKKNTVFANCSQGKGIKFIREELKFFGKMIINSNNGTFFKSIILLNADKLTIDAQSALRRCIELYSHSSRFFLIIEDKYKLLKPILSRFSEVFIPKPIIKNKEINLYSYNNDLISKKIKYRNNKLVNEDISKIINNITCNEDIVKYSEYFYNNAYSIYDITNYIKNCDNNTIDDENKILLLIIIEKMRKEFRNDELLIIFILNLFNLRYTINLENIAFM